MNIYDLKNYERYHKGMEEVKEHDNTPFYVIDKKRENTFITVAKLNKETNNFYDYRTLSIFDNNLDFDLDDVSIGMSIDFSTDSYYISDITINEDIVKKVEEMNNNKNFNIDKKYYEYSPEQLVDEYFIKQENNGIEYNDYIKRIVRLIVKPLGIKLASLEKGSIYNRLGFISLEEINSIIEALYNIINYHLENYQTNIYLELYIDGHHSIEYQNFINALTNLTGIPEYRFRSNLEYLIASYEYRDSSWINTFIHGNDLKKERPRIIINREYASYEENYLEKSSLVQKVYSSDSKTRKRK